MRILALDLGKYKSVGCDYETESGRHSFVARVTNQQALHDLIVDCEPDRVVIEICSIAGWVCDLVRILGIEMQVASTNDERWQWRPRLASNGAICYAASNERSSTAHARSCARCEAVVGKASPASMASLAQLRRKVSRTSSW